MLWQAVAQFGGQAIIWLSTLVVIRLLRAEDYGLLAMANVLMGILLLMADMGLGSASVQSRDLSQRDLEGLYGLLLATNGGAFLVTVASAPLVARFYDEPRLVAIIAVLATNFLLLSTYVLPSALIVRSLDFRLKARIDVSAMALSATASLSLALAGWGVWALVAGTVTLHATKALSYNVARPLGLRPRLAVRETWGLATFGALLTLDRLLFYAFGQVDIVVGGRLLGAGAIGLYTVALSLASVPVDKLMPIITQVSFSAYARIQDDMARVRRNVTRAVSLVSLAIFPACLGLAAVAPDFVPLVLGERWSGIVLPMQLLCLILPLKAVGAMLPPALFGIGRPQINIANMGFALVFHSVAVFIGVRYGLIGLCLAWVFGYPVIFAITTARAAGALGLPLRDLANACAAPVGASLAMAAVALGSRVLLADAPWPVGRLVLAVLLGAVTYVAIIARYRMQELRDLRALLGR